MINSGYACFDEGALFYGKACSSAIVALTTISAQAFVSSAFVPTAWIAGRYCWGGGDSVNARGVGILWQSTDFYGISPPPTTTTGLGSTMSTGSCISATTMATVDAPAAPDTTTGELAIGDKISIGLGLGVGIPSLLFAAWGVLYARKSYQLKIAKQEVGHNPATAGAVLLEGLSVGIISETDGQERLIDDIREVAGRNKNPTTETKECSNNKRNPKVND
jgi:hypothetical protein